MALFKCKMCGGALEIEEKQTTATCEYCGTTQTLPKLDDEKRANMYDRANHFRRNNEFDKAMGVYEQILAEDSTDAEAYWSILLCRYGIEYVEDPASRQRIPTVNRAQFTSILADQDYKAALKHSDTLQKAIYEKEAKAIDKIQRDILAISNKEEPFDIFICYKETDAGGRRTRDSVIAQDLYKELTEEGFKVFFARITLEDKLGSAYEPYIFAALNSASVMVVLGTKAEHFNAVWVKNEWSRYLSLIKGGAKKMLIPAYRDMDPYDLPDEFSHLQAQDMSKLGFMQDLVHGIKKIVKTAEPELTVIKETVVTPAAANVAPLLKRAFMFLEDGDWARADEMCEQVLNQDPENGQAYLAKLLAELQVGKKTDLAKCKQPFDNSSNYRKVIRFCDSDTIAELRGYVKDIKDRCTKEREEKRKADTYYKAMDDYKSSNEDRVNKAAYAFESLGDYKDSASRVKMCHDKILHLAKEKENAKKEKLYSDSVTYYNSNKIGSVEVARDNFASLGDYKDSAKRVSMCNNKIAELTESAKTDIYVQRRQNLLDMKDQIKEMKQNRKKYILFTFIGILCAIMLLFLFMVGCAEELEEENMFPAFMFGVSCFFGLIACIGYASSCKVNAFTISALIREYKEGVAEYNRDVETLRADAIAKRPGAPKNPNSIPPKINP